ncbi:hypothetical protein DSO57_1017771 [Entomophthora muscae]|uniref:Uncharacterized protein n=1 Tax=Entomophthora muscae TaxID=34485 RepID=A0ACC2S6U6_9FUNG|nr:hypothetical protein DSO57_1017771 [Entomophthora muscae]
MTAFKSSIYLKGFCGGLLLVSGLSRTHYSFHLVFYRNRRAAQPRFIGTEPLQAEAPAKSQSQNTSIGVKRQGKFLCELHELEVFAGNQSSPAAREKRGIQDQPHDHNPGTRNQRAPSQVIILLLLYPDVLATHPHISQYFDEALLKNTKSSRPPATLPADFCPPGAPVGPVHFTKYPLKLKYKDYTPEKILELDLLAHIQSESGTTARGPGFYQHPSC